MEDYIFILIAIVLSAVGALNRNKKKKMAAMEDQQVAPKKQPSVFEQLFNDPLFDDEPSSIPTPAPAKKTVAKLTREPLKKETSRAMPIAKKEKPVLLEEEKEDESTVESIMNDFSLKKAVIYSEILERKY